MTTYKVIFVIFGLVLCFGECARARPQLFKVKKQVQSEMIQFGGMKLKKSFDVSYDSKVKGIFISNGFYDQFYKYLGKLSIQNCTQASNSTTDCQFSGNLNALPSLILTKDNQTLSIPSKLWFVKTKKDSNIYKLNVQKIVSNTSSSSLEIILGQDIMKFAVSAKPSVTQKNESLMTTPGAVSFIMKNEKMSFAPSVSKPYSTSLSPLTIIVLVSVVLGIVMLVACCYCCQTKYSQEGHQNLIEESAADQQNDYPRHDQEIHIIQK